ncbi:MAG TPA: hypothetical protein VIV12_12925 [Streptosporangiaceae bacterium]
MDAYYTTPVGPFAGALGANFNTFTTRQDVSPVPCPIIQPNQLRIGTRIKMEAEGEWSATATPTLVLGFWAGAVGASGGVAATTFLIAESSAFTLSAITNIPWRLEWRGIVTVTGTSGSVVGSGDIEIGTSLTAFTDAPIPITLALRTITWDTTLARACGVCATFSASSVSNNVRVYNHTVLLLN